MDAQKEFLQKLYKFQNSASYAEFTLMFPSQAGHLYSKFKYVHNSNVISFYNYLDSENEVLFINYINSL